MLIAFSSYRDRPKHPQVYFYEHDGVAKGKIVGSIDTVTNRAGLPPDRCPGTARSASSLRELENQTSKIFVYDMTQKKLVTPAKLNESTDAQLHPTINADGKLIAFAAWDKAGIGQRWDVLLYDLAGQEITRRRRISTCPSSMNVCQP